MKPKERNVRQNSKRGKLVFLFLLPLLMTGCIKQTLPDVGPSCEFELGPKHQKKGLSWEAMKTAMCKITDGAMCSTEVARILVTQPAQIDITKYKNIAFTNIGGNAGEDFSAAIMEQMVKNKDINVIDRNQMAALLNELSITQEDLFNQTNQIKLGELLPGTMLVTGKVNYTYNENLDRTYNRNCINPLTGQRRYNCHDTKRSGLATVKGNLKFTDTQTGRIIQVKRLSTSFGDSASTKNFGTPDRLNPSEIQDLAIERAAEELIHSIVPWQEERHVIFYKDRDVPKLERGIAEAQAGELETAKKIFYDAIAEIESSPNFDKEDLAAAKFNLGVIKTYERKHEEAEKLFSEVDDLALKVFPAVQMRQINKCLRAKDKELQSASLATSPKFLCG